MALELKPLGTLRFKMVDTVRVPNSPSGVRVIVQFSEVTWRGDRLNAQQHGPLSADWLTVGPEGTATLDIRLTLKSSDGAIVFVQGHGRTDAAKFAAEGGPMYFAPRFETAAPSLAWLNRVQAIGRGMSQGDVAEFEMYEVA